MVYLKFKPDLEYRDDLVYNSGMQSLLNHFKDEYFVATKNNADAEIKLSNSSGQDITFGYSVMTPGHTGYVSFIAKEFVDEYSEEYINIHAPELLL